MNEKTSMPLLLEEWAAPLGVSHAPKPNRKHLALTDYLEGDRGSRFKNIAGKQFGKWRVLDHVRRYGRCKLMWHCRCDCGVERWVNAQNLHSGKTTSCGCQMSSISRSRFTTHGSSKTAEYKIWMAMKMRCYNQNSKAWINYGQRGIIVCERWRNSFPNFIADIGLRPSPHYSLERINVNGNYEPSNCKWATSKEQRNNQRRSEFFKKIARLKELGLINHYSRITPKGMALIVSTLPNE